MTDDRVSDYLTAHDEGCRWHGRDDAPPWTTLACPPDKCKQASERRKSSFQNVCPGCGRDDLYPYLGRWPDHYTEAGAKNGAGPCPHSNRLVSEHEAVSQTDGLPGEMYPPASPEDNAKAHAEAQTFVVDDGLAPGFSTGRATSDELDRAARHATEIERSRIEALIDPLYESWLSRHPCNERTQFHVTNYIIELKHAIRKEPNHE
jgi:hypothetical protein